MSTLTPEKSPESARSKRRPHRVRRMVIIIMAGVTTGTFVTATSGVGAGAVAGIGTAAAVKALLDA